MLLDRFAGLGLASWRASRRRALAATSTAFPLTPLARRRVHVAVQFGQRHHQIWLLKKPGFVWVWNRFTHLLAGRSHPALDWAVDIGGAFGSDTRLPPPVVNQRIYARSVLAWALAVTVRLREVPE